MKVFIAGPRTISVLPADVKERLNNIFNKGYTILVGDANGVDKAVQKYILNLQCNRVKVYAANGEARNNLGNWEVVKVEVPPGIKGFDYYAAKDLEMARGADYGFMIWNGKSRGTLNNMVNLAKLNKKTLLYFLPQKKFHTIKALPEIQEILQFCDEKARKDYAEIHNKEIQQAI